MTVHKRIQWILGVGWWMAIYVGAFLSGMLVGHQLRNLWELIR